MASECVNSVPVMIIYIIKYQDSVEKNNGILEGVDGFRWSHTEREAWRLRLSLAPEPPRSKSLKNRICRTIGSRS